ncbi:hypothetical protein HT594_00074 [Phenacoccus solenopsis nudivirus]|nr:hypothetical protein HT594_00074 [Phenacoccus solenopsis nudivirus]
MANTKSQYAHKNCVTSNDASSATIEAAKISDTRENDDVGYDVKNNFDDKSVDDDNYDDDDDDDTESVYQGIERMIYSDVEYYEKKDEEEPAADETTTFEFGDDKDERNGVDVTTKSKHQNESRHRRQSATMRKCSPRSKVIAKKSKNRQFKINTLVESKASIRNNIIVRAGKRTYGAVSSVLRVLREPIVVATNVTTLCVLASSLIEYDTAVQFMNHVLEML